jgi:predicted RNase H-like HicB family nuclease
MKIEVEKESDGRWIAEIGNIPGLMCYGATQEEAILKVESLALRVIADRLEQGESVPEISEVFSVAI